MSAAIDRLRKALQFLDACRADPANATAAASWDDARKWIEEAARAVVAEAENTATAGLPPTDQDMATVGSRLRYVAREWVLYEQRTLDTIFDFLAEKSKRKIRAREWSELLTKYPDFVPTVPMLTMFSEHLPQFTQWIMAGKSGDPLPQFSIGDSVN